MKKLFLFITLSLLVSAGIFALEVDKSELEKANDTTIEFINYTGPHKVIDSISAIKGIGRNLGIEVAKDPVNASQTRNSNKYYVIHAVDNQKNGKLDADILFIGEEATVDHIVNLRRIISAYLSSAYGYSEKDADTLSVFITVYNAVYRGKLDVFQGKYKDIVVKNLTSENCGLSVTYKDWPGKSQIVIPLFDVANGGLSTVDTSVISDSKVVSSMKEDDDMNVDSRKDMVDIKEREADQATEKAKESQKKAVEEQKKLDQEKQKTKEAKKEADEAKKKADEKAKTAKENPNDKKAQDDAKKAKEESDKKKEEVKQQEEKQAEQEKITETAKEDAKEAQERADKKNAEAQAERKEIAKDQNEIQKKEIAAANMNTEYGIVLTDETQLLSRLVKFNIENGDVVKNSPVTVIRNRTVFKADSGYIAIAGENTKKGAIKLVTIDPESMEISAESENFIAADSMLIKDGEDYYCVVEEGSAYYLAKFGSDLSLKLKSKTQVKPSTPITITESGIVVTDKDGKLKVLEIKDLSDIAE